MCFERVSIDTAWYPLEFLPLLHVLLQEWHFPPETPDTSALACIVLSVSPSAVEILALLLPGVPSPSPVHSR